MLLLGEHSHHDECVEVDALAEHPEIVATQHVHVEEVQDLAAHLRGEPKHEDWILVVSGLGGEIISIKHSQHHLSMS